MTLKFMRIILQWLKILLKNTFLYEFKVKLEKHYSKFYLKKNLRILKNMKKKFCKNSI